MPNAKKKRQAKNEDFQKKKLKVGKKKALPDNHTDTSFRSKSITLPNQSITEDKSKHATTSRNLTLTDLLAQLRHYNAGVKKDALAGLEELYHVHPGVLTASLGQVVNGIVRLFIDEDRDVRKAVLHFCEDVVPSLDKADLQPFMPLLVMYTCSAMSHIYEDVRNDAVKLMDLWVDTAPEILANQYWSRVVGIYTSLLSVSSTATTKASSSIAGAPKITNADSAKAAAAKSHLHLHKSKLGLLESLSKFLQAGLTKDYRQDKLWFLANFLESQHARDDFKRKMKQFKSSVASNVIPFNPNKPTTCQLSHPRLDCFIPYLSTPPKMTLNIFGSSGPRASSRESKDSSGSVDEAGQGEKTSVKMLIETFQPVLLSTWMETASAVFGASSTINYTPALQLLQAILHLTLVLWRTLVSGDELEMVGDAWLEKHCHQLLKHFVVYFPYGSDALGDGGAKADAALREMNIETCELASLFLLAKLAGSEKSSDLADLDWTEKVLDYILGVLGYEQDRTSSNFKESDLTALLPAVWGFLNALEGKDQYTIFKAFVEYYGRCHANSGLKRTALEFMIGIYLVKSNPSYNGRFTLDESYRDIMKTWLYGLPKTLWHLRTSQPETSSLILNFLCEAAKRDDKDIFDRKALESTELAMIPFFYVHLATRGDLYGPFIQLPKETQKRALEFVYYVNSGSEKVQSAIAKCQTKQQV